MAGYQFPPAAPTLSGDVLSINRFLKDPLVVLRALRTLGDQMFISDRILTEQLWTESGSVEYETNETIYADRAPSPVAPGGEYPLTPISTGVASLTSVVKWGQDTLFEDESISRQKYPVVTRGLIKLGNSHVKTIDSLALSVVQSSIVNSTAAIAPWTGSGASPQILRDLMQTVANIIDLLQGYNPNAVLLSMQAFAQVCSDPQLMLMLSREYPGIESTPVRQGLDSKFAKQIGGLTFIASPNIPASGSAIVLDTTLYGAFVDERLDAPGYVQDDRGLQVKTMRNDDTDGWRVRARRITVPIVKEARAAWEISGIGA